MTSARRLAFRLYASRHTRWLAFVLVLLLHALLVDFWMAREAMRPQPALRIEAEIALVPPPATTARPAAPVAARAQPPRKPGPEPPAPAKGKARPRPPASAPPSAMDGGSETAGHVPATTSPAQPHAAGVASTYLGQIAARLRQYVNPLVCGEGSPVVVFTIALLPSGELRAPPQLQQSSGIPACDAAVERAILQAQPLPLPADPEWNARLRDLTLAFRPNDTQ